MITNSQHQHFAPTEPGREQGMSPQFERQRTDFELVQASLDALGQEGDVPPRRFSVQVHDGFVTLHGSADWYYQRAAAGRAVRFLAGVIGVRNEISVSPPLVIRDVKRRINNALHSAVSLDAKRVRVEVAGDVVTLKGTLRSSVEREDALRAAWSAPGVQVVRDELEVSN